MQAGAMAASPMMMETTTKQPEIKQDTSMGQRYQFNAGAQTPTPIPDVPGYGNQGLNFGRERQYFNPSYTAIDDDAAKKHYGFASGGPIQDMSNANNMAAYMGMDKFADGGEIDEYTYDPVTQMYTKKAGEGATVVSPINATYGASGSSGSSEYVDSNPGWSGKTPAERAAYYAENPTMAAITQALQKGFGYTTLGMAQNYFTPDIPAHAGMEARGIDPGAYSERNAMAELGSRDALPGTTSVNLGLPDYPTYTGDQPGDYDGQSGGNQSGNSETGGLGSGDGGMGSGGGRSAGDARGGFYTNGKFDQRPANMAQGGLSALAQGGISNLGDYSDGGRLLRGPGDGISDSIPAMIGKKQPARLADGEFVVPARIVSELGNGSTEAGARKLYAMMDRVQKARKKTVGKGKVAANSRAAKYLPA